MTHSIVQIAGGNRITQDAYTGVIREISAVTDAHEIRLHDGSKLGGYRFLNSEQNDARYQVKNVELTAITGLNQAKEIGILVRKGEGSYVGRKLVPDAASLKLVGDDEQGLLADFKLSIADIVSKDVNFSGAITINSLLATSISGPLTGDVTGNLAGNVTGNVTGNVAGNLTGDAAGNHTGSFTGSVDVRGVGLLLDNNQIPLTAVNANLIQVGDARLAFPGFIGMFSGLIAAIPVGWALCDGTQGTPDLRGRMVIGAGGLYSENDTGGAATHDHGGTVAVAAGGAHSHGITVADHVLVESEIPSHTHMSSAVMDFANARVASASSVASTPIDQRIDHRGGNSPGYSYDSLPTGGGGGHGHTASSAAAATHTHAGTIVSANNLPPFYALAFIMKL